MYSGLAIPDNGAEFADERTLSDLLSERDGEIRPFCCNPRHADRRGGCERNHVELRRLPPKGSASGSTG